MLRSIQVLRGIAAVAVVIHHADRTEALGGAARIGAAGVDLFFVISGFIMVSVASGKRPAQFLADRFWRIYPLWLVALLPWLLLQTPSWQTLATSLTFWPLWNGVFTMPALYVGWSLGFEIIFYLAFAAALAGGVRFPLAIYGLCLVAGLLVASRSIAYLGSPLALEFLAGCLIARLPRSERIALPLLGVALIWLALAPTGYHGISFGPHAFARLLAWGIPAALIVYSAWSLERHFAGRWNALLAIGTASYSIYLTHPLVLLFDLSFVPATLASIALGLGVCTLIEQPLLRLRSAAKTNPRLAIG